MNNYWEELNQDAETFQRLKLTINFDKIALAINKGWKFFCTQHFYFSFSIDDDEIKHIIAFIQFCFTKNTTYNIHDNVMNVRVVDFLSSKIYKLLFYQVYVYHNMYNEVILQRIHVAICNQKYYVQLPESFNQIQKLWLQRRHIKIDPCDYYKDNGNVFYKFSF